MLPFMPFEPYRFGQSQVEKDIILAMKPIFGGTTPAVTDPPATTTQQTQPPATETQQGGEQTPAKEPDPVEQLINDPNAVRSLLQQIDKLQKDLGKVSGERDGYLQKQSELERAQMNKEQQQAKDIENLQNQVEQQDRVIRQMAITNAFLTQGDYQWNSVKQAMSELTEDDYQIDVDLANSAATVTGMEAAVARIAKNCPWLLKGKASTDGNGSGGGTRQRGSGLPPAPPTGNEAKVAKRNDLIKKFPVIATGR
jgi:hypothetical protein